MNENFPFTKSTFNFHTNKFECKMLLYAPARLVWERQKKAFKIHFQAQLMRHRVAIILFSCSPWNFMERQNLQVNKFCGHIDCAIITFWSWMINSQHDCIAVYCFVK